MRDLITNESKPAGAMVAVGPTRHKEREAWDAVDYHHSTGAETGSDGRYAIRLDTPWMRYLYAEKPGFTTGRYRDEKEIPYFHESEMGVKSAHLVHEFPGAAQQAFDDAAVARRQDLLDALRDLQQHFRIFTSSSLAVAI